jgi:hypothetical protein
MAGLTAARGACGVCAATAAGAAGDESMAMRQKPETPYSQEFVKGINRNPTLEPGMCVTGSGSGSMYGWVQDQTRLPATRHNVPTRASSHSGGGGRLNSRERAIGMNARPQTQQNPFFVAKKGRLNSGVAKSKRILNMSLYPS